MILKYGLYLTEVLVDCADGNWSERTLMFLKENGSLGVIFYMAA